MIRSAFRFPVSSLLAGLLAIVPALAAEPAAAEWRDLFNGKDLAGWSGDPLLWKVADGVLAGETDGAGRKAAANTFLIWQGGEPGDFELEFTARVTGKNNSGVQYRSRVLDAAAWAVAGYQLDLHPAPAYLGMFYEEKGRGIITENGKRVVLDPAKRVTAEEAPVPADLAAWNDFKIVARGDTLRHYVNGKLAAETRDLDPAKRAAKGVIAIQLHGGPPMKVEIKRIRLREGAAAE
jgi:hypothetical protein